MPRKPKVISPTGIYHWITRGIKKQNIFRLSKDYSKFLSLIKEYKEIYNITVYHYCLMTNHVHMLIKTIDAASLGGSRGGNPDTKE